MCGDTADTGAMRHGCRRAEGGVRLLAAARGESGGGKGCRGGLRGEVGADSSAQRGMGLAETSGGAQQRAAHCRHGHRVNHPGVRTGPGEPREAQVGGRAEGLAARVRGTRRGSGTLEGSRASTGELKAGVFGARRRVSFRRATLVVCPRRRRRRSDGARRVAEMLHLRPERGAALGLGVAPRAPGRVADGLLVVVVVVVVAGPGGGRTVRGGARVWPVAGGGGAGPGAHLYAVGVRGGQGGVMQGGHVTLQETHHFLKLLGQVGHFLVEAGHLGVNSHFLIIYNNNLFLIQHVSLVLLSFAVNNHKVFKNPSKDNFLVSKSLNT